MALHQKYRRIVAALRRWREERATLLALARLDPRARAELETLVRLRRDLEFDSKGRSEPGAGSFHIARGARGAHS
jgi:hypothetical protein